MDVYIHTYTIKAPAQNISTICYLLSTNVFFFLFTSSVVSFTFPCFLHIALCLGC